jgi:hypothetical protein
LDGLGVALGGGCGNAWRLLILGRPLRLAIDTVINSPDARWEGFGQIKGPHLSLMASQVSDAFNTKTRVNPDAVWDGSMLPSAAELNIPATSRSTPRRGRTGDRKPSEPGLGQDRVMCAGVPSSRRAASGTL